jgi:FkbM family methyltransferase
LERVGNRARVFLRTTAEHAFVRADAAAAKRSLRRTGSRGLFVDCGSNLGQGFSYFSRHFAPDYFDYVLIEPNPHCIAGLRASIPSRTVVDIIEAAASTAEGSTKFFGLVEDHRGATSDGGSIVREHNSVSYEAKDGAAIVVRTFSLADFIAERRKRYDLIVMKMDIEGAEYDVLEDMLRKQSTTRLFSLYVEFHAQYMREPEAAVHRAREAAIVTQLRNQRIRFRRWH